MFLDFFLQKKVSSRHFHLLENIFHLVKEAFLFSRSLILFSSCHNSFCWRRLNSSSSFCCH